MKRRNPADAPRRITVDAAKKREAALEKRVNKRIAKLEPLVLRTAAENHILKGRFNNIEQAFYEFFTGIEASQRAAASFKPLVRKRQAKR